MGMEARTAAARFLDSPALAEGTRRAYRVDVGEFCAWLEARGLSDAHGGIFLVPTRSPFQW